MSAQCCLCLLQAGIVPGKMAKICPHTSTGRADYFGSAVNRAARLLCAAKAGQVLVEEQVMDSVITEWRAGGGNAKSCPWVKGMRSSDNNPGVVPADLGSRLQVLLGGANASDDEPAELANRSKSVPLTAIRRMALTGRASKQIASNVNVPGSVSSRGSSDTGNGEPEDAYCTPYASHSPLACSNCHMLGFLAASGPVVGRREDGAFRSNAYRSLASEKHTDSFAADVSSSRILLASASLDTSFDPGKVAAPLLRNASTTPSRSFDTAPHKVAWQDGISFQMAKHIATAAKQGRHCAQPALSSTL